MIIPAVGAPNSAAMAPDIRLPKDIGNMAKERTPMTRPRISSGVNNSSKDAIIAMLIVSEAPAQAMKPRDSGYQDDPENARVAIPAEAEAPTHTHALCRSSGR